MQFSEFYEKPTRKGKRRKVSSFSYPVPMGSRRRRSRGLFYYAEV